MALTLKSQQTADVAVAVTAEYCFQRAAEALDHGVVYGERGGAQPIATEWRELGLAIAALGLG